MVRREVVVFPETIHAWTLDVGADAWAVSGRRHGVMDDAVAARESGVQASSLILGATAQQATWVTVGDTVPLLPLGAVTRDADLQVSLQLINDGEDQSGTATIELIPFGVGRAAVPPLLTIASAQPVPAGYSLLARHVGLQQVAPGLYSLLITVETERGLSVRRAALLDVR